MGQTPSHFIKDPQQVQHLQQVYDTSLALMIVNLILGFLLQASMGWIPLYGGWIQLFLLLMSLTFSILIYKMSNRFLPKQYSRGLNISQLVFYIITSLVCLIGSSVQAVLVPMSGSYYYWSYTFFFIALNNMVVPILAFIAMVLFSIQCSYLWNEACHQAQHLAAGIQMVPIAGQTAAAGAPVGQVVVPVRAQVPPSYTTITMPHVPAQ